MIMKLHLHLSQMISLRTKNLLKNSSSMKTMINTLIKLRVLKFNGKKAKTLPKKKFLK